MVKSASTRNAAAGRIFRARALLFLERLWPALLPALGVVAVFALASLFNLWRFLPWWAHLGLLGAMVAACVALLVRDLKDLAWPSRAEALDRLEKDAHIPHAALRSREDKPFRKADSDNPLWRAHLVRMERLAATARLDKARATADKRDPYNLRYGAVLLILLGLLVAWGDIGGRFWQAVSPRPVNDIPVSVDLWVDPPAYTGRAPVMLVQGSDVPEGTQGGIAVPAGSTLHARIAGVDRRGPGRARLDIETQDGRDRPDLERTENSLTGEATLSDNAAVSLLVNGRRATWPVVVAADVSPKIRFSEPPAATEENQLRLVVELEDDYGITETQAVLRLDPDQDRPLDTPRITEARAQEDVTLPVSGLTGAYGTRSAEIDLTDHPWAGLDVFLSIVGKDGAGQQAQTQAHRITLPERDFYNPLAQAIIHERRNLAVAPETWTTTSRSLDALTFAPDRFFDKPTDYLLLRTAYWDVMAGKGENVDEMIEAFWPLALQLEDQALELARRALEQAQRALREALERGASQSEVERLVENLRLAMQNYIQALAESGRSMAQDSQNSRELGARDLNDILDSITDMSGSGANNAARQLLSELEQMLQNLQIAQGGGGEGTGRQGGQPGGRGGGQGEGGEPQGAGGEAAQRTGDLIGRQRELADETFDAERRSRGGAPDQRPGGDEAQALRQRQQDLTSELGDLLEQLDQAGPGGQGLSSGEEQGRNGQSGMAQGEMAQGGSEAGAEAARAFRRAQRRMEDATQALENGNLGAAGRYQEDALEELRAGADGVSQQIMQAQQGQNEGENGQGQGAAAGGANARLDPLGRPYGAPAPGGDIGIPDLSNPERARELIMELRRKLSEPGRSEEEIDYLERLLERF